MCVCKYLNQRVRRTGEHNGKSFKGVSKTKKKKNTRREKTQLSFYYRLPVVEKCLEKCLPSMMQNFK